MNVSSRPSPCRIVVVVFVTRRPLTITVCDWVLLLYPPLWPPPPDENDDWND